MSKEFTAVLDNAEELLKALDELATKISRKYLREAIKQGAKNVKAVAEVLAPSNTGELKQSLRVKAGKQKRNRVSYQVESTDPKAIHIEFGTSDTPEQSFLRQALEAAQEEVLAIIEDSIIAACSEAKE